MVRVWIGAIFGAFGAAYAAKQEVDRLRARVQALQDE